MDYPFDPVREKEVLAQISEYGLTPSRYVLKKPEWYAKTPKTFTTLAIAPKLHEQLKQLNGDEYRTGLDVFVFMRATRTPEGIEKSRQQGASSNVLRPVTYMLKLPRGTTDIVAIPNHYTTLEAAFIAIQQNPFCARFKSILNKLGDDDSMLDALSL